MSNFPLVLPPTPFAMPPTTTSTISGTDIRPTRRSSTRPTTVTVYLHLPTSPGPKTRIALLEGYDRTTCADLCHLVKACPVFKPFLSEDVLLRVCCAGSVEWEGEKSLKTLDKLGVGREGECVVCLIYDQKLDPGGITPKKAVAKAANALISDVSDAFRRTDFRFGKFLKFGNAGKIGIE
ncbi:uncharacterized protein SPPG_01255 [Spizellomyces punctatus DAOM BR117]|uniref:Uncharacterized protein n=1 Tax=Spizellomyces punctatus (strain DAOM BR117) TaxID=645134 RepID=A0A0L0HRR0_SPIPD|nr:uncharacterized protein SPPG_01255 [Spizellomyces punctatus DAOM BR117]KND03798.1 hypothetical protein SPPG_01255 [Spizellomyces punctatus DAOM BR117]|eukprot:XP_016611837.1 hypothetical protein SPPG_01255 [Spizellomyces punctatus DAOM BR117]